MSAVRPLVREALILYYRWALHDMGPMHRDVPHVVHRLRDLRAERATSNSIYTKVAQWL